MATDSRTDDASSVRGAVGPLVAGLSKAVFGVCAVAVGALTLLLAVGDTTGESGTALLVLGVTALVIGVATISRLPKPNGESATDPVTAGEDSEQ